MNKAHTEPRTYAVLYEKGPTGWGAYVPDFDGCIATGKTRQEVEVRIREALALHLKGMAADGGAIPEPTLFPGQVTLDVEAAPAALKRSA